MVQMISHGLISGALFLCIGVMYDRLHTREISAYGGVINVMPKFGAFMVLFALANSGPARHLGLRRRIPRDPRELQGQLLVRAAGRHDPGARRRLQSVAGQARDLRRGRQRAGREDAGPESRARSLVLGVLALAVLLLGVWPAPMLNMMEASVQHLLQQILTSKIPAG